MSNLSRTSARAPMFVPPTRKPAASFQPHPAPELAQAARQPLAAAPALTAERTTACPASPRACPFGGACHTCPTGMQKKVRVGEPDDEFEQEADRVAEAVMRTQASAGLPPVIQRQTCAACGEEDADSDLLIQRQAPSAPAVRSGHYSAPAAAAQLPPTDSGHALSPSLRAFFEPRYGHDFSRVRVHATPEAAASARSVNARAYTLGRDIVFGSGEYAPQTEEGRLLLAHELAHVVQQQPDVIQRDGPGTSPGPSVSMPSLTSLLFRYGDLTLRANLPTEVVATLPVELRNVGTMTFSMTADIPNTFTFAVALDMQPHLRIRSQVSYNRERDTASFGLAFQSTQTTCTIANAADVQEQLQAAGQRATTALQNFLSPPETAPSTGGETGPALPPDMSRAIEVGAAIGNLYSKAKAAGAGQRCVTRPTWSINLGVQVPLSPSPQQPDILGPGSRDRGLQPSVGLGFQWNF